MSRCERRPRGHRPSIAYKRSRIQPSSSSVDGLGREEQGLTFSHSTERHNLRPQLESPDILSTPKLISAVGRLWNCVNPPTISDHGLESNQNGGCQRKSFSLGDLGRKDLGRAPRVSYEGERLLIDAKTPSQCTQLVQPKFDFIKVTQKVSALDSHVGISICSSLWPFSGEGTNLASESAKERRIERIGLCPEFKKAYAWTKEAIPAGSQSVVTDNRKSEDGRISISGSKTSISKGHMSGYATLPPGGHSLDGAYSHPYPIESKDAPGFGITESSASYNDCLTKGVLLVDIKANMGVTKALISIPCLDYCIDLVAPHKCAFVKLLDEINEEEVRENASYQLQENAVEDKRRMQAQTMTHEGQRHALAKQEHAFAGACAGTFVSLCLHPVDTIKTVVQSCHTDQKSIWHTGRLIISERGMSGLYRGFASKIASSAPISALYTFTYESVKASLLPFLSKEYQSFAHCIAGGCASIATSFVFTPSEHIKQQMQIGACYRNCWNALVCIIEKGGFTSLYGGWGAVLCRNVPHSVIKFYAYENFKQCILSSHSSSDKPSTLRMLVCGGLAGSTAAFFTTPFDVVKTRLQTQIPGSICHYNGVFHAVHAIGKSEGLRGLYRGLLPRIMMYMSQGALFFASYEFFKRLLDLEMGELHV